MLQHPTIKPAVFTCREGEGVRIGRDHGVTVQAIEAHRLVLLRDDQANSPCVLRTGDRLELPSAIITVTAIGIDGKKRTSLEILRRYEWPEVQFEFRATPSLA